MEHEKSGKFTKQANGSKGNAPVRGNAATTRHGVMVRYTDNKRIRVAGFGKTMPAAEADAASRLLRFAQDGKVLVLDKQVYEV